MEKVRKASRRRARRKAKARETTVKRGRETIPILLAGVQKHKCDVVCYREPIERRHLEDQALLGRRRRDLENNGPAHTNLTSKGPDAPRESERIAHSITHLPPAPWCETCVLGRGIETPDARLTPPELDEHHCYGFRSEKGPGRGWRSR